MKVDFEIIGDSVNVVVHAVRQKASVLLEVRYSICLRNSVFMYLIFSPNHSLYFLEWNCSGIFFE